MRYPPKIEGKFWKLKCISGWYTQILDEYFCYNDALNDALKIMKDGIVNWEVGTGMSTDSFEKIEIIGYTVLIKDDKKIKKVLKREDFK